MHVRDLVELAALISANAPALLATPHRINSAGLKRYWAASRCRFDRWGHAIKHFTVQCAGVAQQPAVAAGPPVDLVSRPQIRGVIEEILAGEILSRGWAGLLAAHDQRAQTNDAEPIARAVLGGHLEARHRALSLLIHGPGVDSHDALQLNRLRRTCERWTDLLLGHIVLVEDVSLFAVNPQTAREFAADLADHGSRTREQAWSILLISLRAAFRNLLGPDSPNEDLNNEIATGVIGCFGPDAFDATGLMHALWTSHLTQAANDAQALLDGLFTSEAPPPLHRRLFGDRS
ncbi:MAG: hypothetical protein WD403_08175 [Pirellulales bacterium]